MTDPASPATGRQLTRHIYRASKRLTAAGTTLTAARDEITAAVELLRSKGYNPEEIANDVTGEIFHLTVIARDLAGDDEYMGWAEAITELAAIIANLTETLAKHGDCVTLFKAGESYKNTARRTDASERRDANGR